MKVILYREVPSLGEEGDIKTVADGYARNYLIPQKLAVRYTKVTETELAQKQQAISRRKAEKALSAAGDKAKIESLEMQLLAVTGESGKLFGSVTSSAIVEYLHTQGIMVERKRIELPENGIKVVGNHTVTVKLHGGEKALLNVNVSASQPKEKEHQDEVFVNDIDERNLETQSTSPASESS